MMTGCSSESGYKNVAVDEAEKLIAEGKVEVIDVRTQEEFASGHIPGAKLLPLQEIESRMDELDKEKTYLVVCRSGNRSAQASEILVKEGFKHIYNMTGGMNEWKGDVEQ
nr:rhodanese-like domain-containing protein [Thermolongibacillus altinsuensis]